MSTRLFVGNLSLRAGPQDLERHFSQVGEVVSVRIPLDRKTQKPRGFGFVELGDREAAAEALERLDGSLLAGRALRVTWARDRMEEGGRRQREDESVASRLERQRKAGNEDDDDGTDAPWADEEDDYSGERRARSKDRRPGKHGKHGSDRVRGRGTRRSL